MPKTHRSAGHQIKSILYLANYAPLEGRKQEEGHYQSYHLEVFNLLQSFGFSVRSSRDGMAIIDQENAQTDYVFSLLNRAPYKGSEILPTALAEYVGLPYLGSSPHIRALADDKLLAKLAVRGLSIKTAEAATYGPFDPLLPPSFGGPYFVKPRSGAASNHIDEDSLQTSTSGLLSKIRSLREAVDEVLVEQFISGTNISLPIIGGKHPRILPPYQLYSSKTGEIVTAKQKRRLEKGLTRTIVKSPPLVSRLTRIGKIIYDYLGPIDYLRIEFRLPHGGEPIFTEFNVCANIGSRSGFAFSAKDSGIAHEEMLKSILDASFWRQEVAWQAL